MDDGPLITNDAVFKNDYNEIENAPGQLKIHLRGSSTVNV